MALARGIAALLMGGMCLGTAAHAAHRGRIVGSVVGASGPTARHVPTGVAVIDGSTGEIGAAGRARGPWRFRLAIPPGVYHVLVSIVQQSDTLSGLSPLLAVTVGHTTDTEIGIAADVSPAVAAAILVQPETAVSGGVATMGDVIVQNPAGFPPVNGASGRICAWRDDGNAPGMSLAQEPEGCGRL